MRASFRQQAFPAALLVSLSILLGAAAPVATGTPPVANAQARTAMEARDTLTAKIEPRIKDLHARLQITAAQQPLWEGFAQVMRDNTADMDATARGRMQTLSGMTAEENIASYAKIAAVHARNVERLEAPFQALYATLSDHQKQLADQAFRDDARRGSGGGSR